jgi:hypothetical protein
VRIVSLATSHLAAGLVVPEEASVRALVAEEDLPSSAEVALAVGLAAVEALVAATVELQAVASTVVLAHLLLLIHSPTLPRLALREARSSMFAT